MPLAAFGLASLVAATGSDCSAPNQAADERQKCPRIVRAGVPEVREKSRELSVFGHFKRLFKFISIVTDFSQFTAIYYFR